MQKLTLLLAICLVILSSCNKRVHQSILTIPSKKEINQAQTPVYVGEVSDIQIPPKPTHSKAHFDAAFREITAMLEGGKTGLDFKKAVFLTENAYLNQQLDYLQFEAIIDQMVDFCRVIQENTVLDEPYELEDREEMMRNLAIYRFMADTLNILQESDTLKVSDSFSSFSILPYQYNFKDFAGQADWTNTFVSKLIATGQGNCRSMPYLYKILAEEMDAPAYFCLTPNHLYLTHPNEKVGWYNTELTSGSFPKDAWLMAAGYVPLEGIQSGIYMKNLTETEEIALTLVDLAQSYQARFGKDHNPEFVLQCTEKALAYFPLCINAQLLQAQALSDLYEANKNPLTFQRLEELCRSILDLGYIPPPQEAVVASLQNGQADKYQSHSTKTPYFQHPTNQRDDDKFAKNALTLSNGRYDEFLELEVLVQIGKAVFDTEQDRIVSWVKDSDGGDLGLRGDLMGRFLSVDPLEKKYPHYSPYSFSGNKLVHAIELEGLEEWEINKLDGSTGTISGPYMDQRTAQIEYDKTIDITTIEPKDRYEKDILTEHITYNLNYGWVDEGHAFQDTKRTNPTTGIANLWRQLLSESVDYDNEYHVVGYNQDYIPNILGTRLFSIGNEYFYKVKKGLSMEDRQRVALTIVQDVTLAYESFQGLASDSSFEPADLPSNMLSFYRTVLYLDKVSIKSLIQPLNTVSALRVYRMYPGTFSDKKYKNYDFKPRFFYSVYTPKPYSIPSLLQSITPMPFGDKVSWIEARLLRWNYD